METIEDSRTEWIDLPGKRKRTIKRKMSTLPSLFRLKSPKFYGENEENFDIEEKSLSTGIFKQPQNKGIVMTKIGKDYEGTKVLGDIDRTARKDKILPQRTVSKFYEYDSIDSNGIEQKESILNKINPILTLLDSFDLQRTRKGYKRSRYLTYSSSNMKRYKKLIIDNQELFQIVTKLDFVVKTLNTNELLDILSDVRTKMDLIEKYDQDLQYFRKQKEEQKTINGDQIYLVSEYFTLMHAHLSKKYDSLAQLITENIEELDFEMKKEEESMTDDNTLYEKHNKKITSECVENQKSTENKPVVEGIDVTNQDTDLLRAKRAREKFQQRGNSKKRLELLRNSLEETQANGKTEPLQKQSNTINCTFTDIKITATDYEAQSENMIQSENPEPITPKPTPEPAKENFQGRLPNSLTISLEFTDDEVFIEEQTDMKSDTINRETNKDYFRFYALDSEDNANIAPLEPKSEETNGKDTNTIKISGDVPQEIKKHKEDEIQNLLQSVKEILEKSKDRVVDEYQLEEEPSETQEMKENLNNQQRLLNSQSNKERLSNGEGKENVKDNYSPQSKKLHDEEKVEQRQTNLHIKETNFHCIANLNKNNLNFYDNEDENKRKEDYFRFYALDSEDNIEFNNDLNNVQIANASDLNYPRHKERKDGIIGDDKESRKFTEMGSEGNLENVEQKEAELSRTSCSFDKAHNETCTSVDNNNTFFQGEMCASNEAVNNSGPSTLSDHGVLDESFNIKISKNDLNSGKVLTVTCPKENIGNTIQMKIELCKCSCLETINDSSTQTDEFNTDTVSTKDHVKQEGVNDIEKGMVKSDTLNLREEFSSESTVKTDQNQETVIRDSKNLNENKKDHHGLIEIKMNTKEDLRQKFVTQKKHDIKFFKPSPVGESQKRQTEVKSDYTKTTVCEKLYQSNSKVSNVGLKEFNIKPNDSEIPRGLVNQLIGRYEVPKEKVGDSKANIEPIKIDLKGDKETNDCQKPSEKKHIESK